MTNGLFFLGGRRCCCRDHRQGTPNRIEVIKSQRSIEAVTAIQVIGGVRHVDNISPDVQKVDPGGVLGRLL